MKHYQCLLQSIFTEELLQLPTLTSKGYHGAHGVEAFLSRTEASQPLAIKFLSPTHHGLIQTSLKNLCAK